MHNIVLKDTAIKREIMNTCEGVELKMAYLQRIAWKYNAVWDDVEQVWCFSDGTRCGCVQNIITRSQAIFFKPDMPEQSEMH